MGLHQAHWEMRLEYAGLMRPLINSGLGNEEFGAARIKARGYELPSHATDKHNNRIITQGVGKESGGQRRASSVSLRRPSPRRWQ